VGRVLVAFVAAGVGFVSIVRFLPKVPLFGRLVLQTELAGTAPSLEAAAHRDLSGCRGHAVTPLRPSGKIQIDGEIYDVVAEGEFVAQGEPVEVLRSEGIRIVVGRAKH
jgi:membrane-bound serine protease (ClpP class)